MLIKWSGKPQLTLPWNLMSTPIAKANQTHLSKWRQDEKVMDNNVKYYIALYEWPLQLDQVII